jgi:hypothetical protein
MKIMKFLHELVNSLYDDEALQTHELSRLLEDHTCTGYFWEKVLAKHMTHTSLCERRNEKGKDFLDGTDAKFAMAGRYTDSFQRVATIGIENKTGTLRVCLCCRGEKFHKVHFMRIPHEAYANLNGQNIKITFSSFNPMGSFWDKYRCSWEEVISP